MKSSYFILSALLCAATLAKAQQTVNVSKTEAEKLVLNKVLSTDVGKVDIYMGMSQS